MAITSDDLLKLLPGSKVVITDCEAAEHGDNVGCLCAVKGSLFTVAQRYQTPFVGTATWHLEGSDKRVRLSEVTLVL